MRTVTKPESTRRAQGRGRGEGSVYQRADGRWCGSISLPNGKRKVVYGRTREEAADNLLEAMVAQKRGLSLPSKRLTLAQYLDDWLAQAVAPRVKTTTLVSYTELAEKHIKPGLGKHRLVNLQPVHVQAFLTDRLQSGLSPRRVQYIHAVLRAALNRAMKLELVHRNVAKLVDPPRARTQEIAPLSAEQGAALLHTARGHRFEHLWTVLLATGLRLGEALALCRDDIDLDRGQLLVRHTLERLPGRPWRLTEPKSVHGARIVPLIAAAQTALRAQQARNAANHLQVGSAWREHGFVFADEMGEPFTSDAARNAFKHVLKRAGLPATTRQHDLRHSCATYLVGAGVPLRTVQEILGHSSIVVTQRYGHVMNAMLADAAVRLDGVFDGIAPPAMGSRA